MLATLRRWSTHATSDHVITWKGQPIKSLKKAFRTLRRETGLTGIYSRPYARVRVTFGKPLIEHQAIAFQLSEMATKIEAARQLYLYAATLKDLGRASPKEASMAKLFASEMAEEVTSAAIQIHGGYGFLNDYPVEKFYHDVRVFQIYDGASEIQKMLIARELAKGN